MRYDYVLNTGDNLAHHFHDAFQTAGGKEADYRSFVVKTLRFVNGMLRKSFPRTPLIYALGNNDAVCGDYMVAPNSKMLDRVARDLPVIAGRPQARHDFAVGGFYVVPHPRVPKHDIIALNSVFWSIKYKDACNKAGGDPGAAELDWLAWTLYQEKLAGRTASLAMHIPPGINGYTSSKHACPKTGTRFWRKNATSRFRALAAEYKDVLRASYAGHTHMDDFRVLSDKSGAPLLVTRITPAVSPRFGNNPAFAVLLYDRTDAVVRNSAIIYLTNADAAGPTVPAKWAPEYAFAQTYGVNRYTAANLAALAQRIPGARLGCRAVVYEILSGRSADADQQHELERLCLRADRADAGRLRGLPLHGQRATAFKIDDSIAMVRPRGLEPPRFYPLPPQGSASTNSATAALEKDESVEKPASLWRRTM